MSSASKIRLSSSSSGCRPGRISISMAIKDKSSKPKEDGAEEETSTQKQPF